MPDNVYSVLVLRHVTPVPLVWGCADGTEQNKTTAARNDNNND